ncbi:hypothetical protein S1OALGB6SA_1806 [Olavius algarvensis spirochete endosymbiont]|nr:hypothetical protein S1OALGB6SA_1806 [Olavius algarvensis spirochete endosymbiont]
MFLILTSFIYNWAAYAKIIAVNVNCMRKKMNLIQAEFAKRTEFSPGYMCGIDAHGARKSQVPAN